MSRFILGLAAAAAAILAIVPAHADSRLFSVRANKDGITVDQALVGGQPLAIAGKGGGITFFRIDNPSGAIPCAGQFVFVASNGQRQESAVDLCAQNWQLTVAFAAAPPAAPPQIAAVPVAKPFGPRTILVGPATSADPGAAQGTQTVTITTDDPNIAISQVFLEKKPVKITSRQGNSVEIELPGPPEAIACQRDLGLKLSDAKTIARRVNICEHDWSVLVLLGDDSALSEPVTAAKPALPAPPLSRPEAPPASAAPPVLALPPPQVVLAAPPGADGQPPDEPGIAPGGAWSFSSGGGEAMLIFGSPQSDGAEFSASCRPQSGQVDLAIMRAVPGLQPGGRMSVTLTAGPLSRTYAAVGSPVDQIAGGSFLQFKVAANDPIWQGLIAQTVLVVGTLARPEYGLSLQGSAGPVRRFLGACSRAVFPAGPEAGFAPPRPGAVAFRCQDGSLVRVAFDRVNQTAVVDEAGAPSILLIREPVEIEDGARYANGASSLIGQGEIIRWSRFGEPGRLCRPG
jgi:hypothetical protein